MLSLTGIPLLIVAVSLAAAAPLLVAWWWRREAKTGWLSALRPFATVLACQLLAVSALFLWVNNEYGFYTSWSDLFGVRTERVTIRSNGLVRHGAGHLRCCPSPGVHARTTLERCWCGYRPSMTSRSSRPLPFQC
jgi:hypothetical protein